MISTTTSTASYTATAGQTVFAYPFRIQNQSDLLVFAESTLGVRTNITADIVSVSAVDNEAGGNVTLPAQTLGTIIYLVRASTFTQLWDASALNFFDPATVERVVDKLTILMQEVKTDTESCLRLDDGELLDPLDKSSRKGKLLSFNATTGALEFIDSQGIIDASTEADFSAASAAASRDQAQAFAGNVNSLGRGVTVAFFTDSIGNYGEGYPYYAQAFAQGALWLSAVKFNPGFTSAALKAPAALAQITGLSPLPHVVVVQCGTNDALSNTPVATFAGNLAEIRSAFESVGCRVVLATVPPLTGAYNQLARAYNNYIHRYAAMNRLAVIPLYELAVDKSTGTWLAANDSGDGVHPSNTCNRLFGQASSDTLSSFFPGGSVNILADANTGGLNLLSNAWLLSDTNIDGIADGWSASPSAGFSYTLVSDSRGWNWQRLSLSGAGGVKQALGTGISIGSTMSVGDRMFIGCRFRTGQSGASAKITIQFTFYTGSYVLVQNFILTSDVGMTQQMADGTVFRDVTVPVGCDLLLMSVQGGPSDGTYDFALPTVINLTKNNLV
jgi:hypothetical protein